MQLSPTVQILSHLIGPVLWLCEAQQNVEQLTLSQVSAFDLQSKEPILSIFFSHLLSPSFAGVS